MMGLNSPMGILRKAGRGVKGYDLLIDFSKQARPRRIPHLDAHAIPEREERRALRAELEHFERATFGEAGRARAAVDVGDRARTHDRAGTEPACARGVRDDAVKVERHVNAGVRLAEWLVVDEACERQMHLALAPRVAKLIRGDRDRRER